VEFDILVQWEFRLCSYGSLDCMRILKGVNVS